MLALQPIQREQIWQIYPNLAECFTALWRTWARLRNAFHNALGKRPVLPVVVGPVRGLARRSGVDGVARAPPPATSNLSRYFIADEITAA